MTLVVPPLTQDVRGHGITLGVFAFLIVIAYGMVCYFVRETVGAADADNPASMTALALEELHMVFNVPMTEFWAYETTVVLPWALSYLAFWSEPMEKPPPLYRWAAKRRQQIEENRQSQAESQSSEATGIELSDMDRGETARG